MLIKASPADAPASSQRADVVFRSRAPLRLGLAGGGTDLSPFSDTYGGQVLNVTIDRYAYASLSFRDDDHAVFRANDIGTEERHPAGEVPTDAGLLLHRAVYNRISRQFLEGRNPAIEVVSSIEAPPGSGLGSSSALVVALVEVYRQAFELPLGLYDVAHLAFEIERIDLAMAGGKQDQYASAFGGVNFIEFLADDRVIVNPLRIARPILNELECSIVVCFSGQSRSSELIIRDQIKAAGIPGGKALENLLALKQDALDMKQALIRGNIAEVATILDRSWHAKKATASSVSNPGIEQLYAVGRANGARCGKLSGAGGGGFMMFITDPLQKPILIRALEAAGGVPDKIVFTHAGVESWLVPNRG
jgi:D-glycero-alpha-D-manno-heptose-7-phosphate kinase